MKRPLLLLCMMCLTRSLAFGHATGESYVFVDVKPTGLEGRFEIGAADMRERLGVKVGPGEDPLPHYQANAERVQAYIREHASFQIGGKPLAIRFTEVRSFGEGGTGWAQFLFEAPTEVAPNVLDVRLALFFEFSRRHRNLLLVERNETTGQTFSEQYAFVFGPTNPTQRVDLTEVPKLLGGRAMVREGIWHIWYGIDHILFILAFLFPTVLAWSREKAGWEPVEHFPRAFANVLSIATVFTIAHSITLGLAALGYISISSRLVESAIALSIILVALGNVLGGKRQMSMAVIFCLGLFHGLGFASVLGHLPFRMMDAVKAVLGFNIGVEIGQIAIIALLFPLLYLFRKHTIYPAVVVRGASVVLAVIAGFWFVQRAFALG